jgi:hypothetical protein
MARSENLDLFVTAYEDLRSSGTRSIMAAYNFGQVVDALSNSTYTLAELASAIDRTASMVSVYRKLYRRYPHVNALLRTAEEMGTYDVSRLAGTNPLVPVRYVFICENCGSSDVARHKESVGEYLKSQADERREEILS